MDQPQITLSSHNPFYDPRTYEFRQLFTFKSPFPLDQDRMTRLVQAASEMFSNSMVMNDLCDHAWPPDQVAVKGSDDCKSGAIEFTTRASRTRPIILDS
jgi:hypothetical protein